MRFEALFSIFLVDAASNDLAQNFHTAFNCGCDSNGDEAVSSEEFLECLPDVLKLFHPLLATLTIDPVQTQVKFDEYDDNLFDISVTNADNSHEAYEGAKI